MSKEFDFQKRRRRLMRSYELPSEYHEYMSGHKPISFLPKMYRLFLMYIEYQFFPHYFGDPPKWRMFLRRFAGKRTLPDFFVVGPMKSGSSDLAVSLMLHPAIIPPLAKEFFLPNPTTWKIYYPTKRAKNRIKRIHGNALSPYLAPFLHWMEMTYRVSQVIPDAKIILTLRDPVQRFYSHWKWEYFWAGKHSASTLPFLGSFNAFVDCALEMFPHYPMYTACGFQALQASIYWKAVKFWIDCFGRESVLVLDMGQYFQDRNRLLRKIQEFVEIPFYEIPATDVKTNENPLRLPPPDEESISKLKTFFRPHNEKLWEVIEKDFGW